MNNNPVGILDSGSGGLTIWQEVTKLLPYESTIYIADSKHFPYGTREGNEVYKLAKKMIAFLLSRNVKLIVLACNTITVSSIERLRTDFPDIPIVGTVPVIKTAAEETKTGKIGVLSTVNTAESSYQKHLTKEFAHGKTVLSIGSDALAPMIEENRVDSEELKTILQAFIDADVDTLALGCSHFPLIKRRIQEIVGPSIHVLDSGPAIARQVARILEHNEIRSNNPHPAYQLFATGETESLKRTLKSLTTMENRVESVTI